MKQGIVFGNTTLATPAPGTAGQSINYLIEAAFQETDTDSTVLPYFNASNPAIPFSGPGGIGTANNTRRAGQCILVAKAGVAATTGTQATPAADAGFTGLFVVTVANGQTTVTSGNINQLATAPFINPKLGQVAAAIQAQSGNYVLDTSGASNTITIAPVPALAAYAAGDTFRIKLANNITGATVVSASGLGNKSLLKPSPSGPTALTGGEGQATQVVTVTFDGNNFQLASPIASSLLSANNEWTGTNRFDKQVSAPTVNLGNLSGNVTKDFSQGVNFTGTLTANITLQNPTNAVDGQAFNLDLAQGTGGQLHHHVPWRDRLPIPRQHKADSLDGGRRTRQPIRPRPAGRHDSPGLQ